MYLTGTNAQDPIGYAIDTLKSTLETGLSSAPWASRLSPYGGLKVTDDIAEATSWLKSRRPHVFIEPGACGEDPSVNFRKTIGGVAKPGARWNIQLEMDIVVSAYAARAEPIAIAAVKDIIKRKYTTLRDAGLEGSDIRASSNDSGETGRICPHTFSCNVHLVY